MSILAIVAIILLGIFLLLMEFLIIPGITIAGIGGTVLIVTGIVMSYQIHGATVGHYMLAGTALVSISSLIVLAKSATWKNISLNKKIDSRIKKIEIEVNVGDVGKTISRLAPVGKVFINRTYLEAEAREFIDEDVVVEVIGVLNDKIIVTPKIDK